ncbi:MAG TPA: M55 family metallopeptidase [Solirubrobacterales bacterium]|nr:M55 family metallopeptidase [Solirubrobacterales bacterium]
MNVLIAADMEGITGIDDCGDCLPSHPAAYARGRRLLTDEVLVAIEALRAAGAERISVGDWHMVGTNIERDRMPAGIEVRPIADLALNEAEPSMQKAHGGPLDAVVMLGHHASTKDPRAFCSHTFIWEMEVSLGGVPLSEVRTYAQALAAEGIPILVASGDRWMLEELEEGELGGARLVATKEGEGRARARSRDLAAVHAELAEAIAAACAAPPSPPPARDYPAELVIAVEGEEIARTTVGDASELLTAVAGVFRTSQVSRDYRQLAKLMPADDGSRLRAARRRAGTLLARPVMAAKERRWLEAAPPLDRAVERSD